MKRVFASLFNLGIVGFTYGEIINVNLVEKVKGEYLQNIFSKQKMFIQNTL